MHGDKILFYTVLLLRKILLIHIGLALLSRPNFSGFLTVKETLLTVYAHQVQIENSQNKDNRTNLWF